MNVSPSLKIAFAYEEIHLKKYTCMKQIPLSLPPSPHCVCVCLVMQENCIGFKVNFENI